MPIKLEFIKTTEPKWHIYYKKQPNSNEGDVIVYKCNGEEMPLANEITGCESNMGDINQYITFYGKVIDNLKTAYHLMPFKDNNVPKEAITGKMITKVEEVIQNAINNNEEFNGICGICPWNCKIDAPQRDDCKSVSIIRALYKTYNLGWQPQIPAEIIESTEIAAAAAESVVESFSAMDIIKEQEQKEVLAKEKEELIAEASRLTGRVEAFGFISQLTTVGTLISLKKIKESGAYKELSGVKTWEDYCKSLGFSRTKIDEDLNNLNTFGEEFLTTVGTFGLGYRELRSLSKSSKTGALQIKDESVVINGEVISLDEKDILKDALTDLVAKNKEEISKLKAENKAKDKMVQTYAEAKEAKEQELKAVKIEKEALKEKIDGFYHGRLGKIAEDDREDFQDITNLEMETHKLISDANLLLEKNYSNFNANMFCAVISKLMVAIDDIRQKAAFKYDYHFDGGILTNEELKNLDNGETPLEFLGEESIPVEHEEKEADVNIEKKQTNEADTPGYYIKVRIGYNISERWSRSQTEANARATIYNYVSKLQKEYKTDVEYEFLELKPMTKKEFENRNK